MKRSWCNHNLLSSKRICVIDRKLICYCMFRVYSVWFLTWIFLDKWSPVPVIIYQDLVFLMFCRNHFANLSISTQWSTYLLYGMMRNYQSRHDHNLKSCLITMFHICVLAVKLLCKIIVVCLGNLIDFYAVQVVVCTWAWVAMSSCFENLCYI